MSYIYVPTPDDLVKESCESIVNYINDQLKSSIVDNKKTFTVIIIHLSGTQKFITKQFEFIIKNYKLNKWNIDTLYSHSSFNDCGVVRSTFGLKFAFD